MLHDFYRWRGIFNKPRINETLNPSHFKTNQLIPWSRVLPDKQTGPQPVKTLREFYGTRRFITSFTRAIHLSLSRARSIQSIFPIPPSPMLCTIFCNISRFDSEELLAPLPSPKLEDHPLSALWDCLFNIFAATLHIKGHPPSTTWGRIMA